MLWGGVWAPAISPDILVDQSDLLDSLQWGSFLSHWWWWTRRLRRWRSPVPCILCCYCCHQPSVGHEDEVWDLPGGMLCRLRWRTSTGWFLLRHLVLATTSIHQMARHTHLDTYTYWSHCCTTTGLSGDAPVWLCSVLHIVVGPCQHGHKVDHADLVTTKHLEELPAYCSSTWIANGIEAQRWGGTKGTFCLTMCYNEHDIPTNKEGGHARSNTPTKMDFHDEDCLWPLLVDKLICSPDTVQRGKIPMRSSDRLTENVIM